MSAGSSGRSPGKSAASSPVSIQPAADEVDLAAVAGDGLLDGGAEAGDGERAGVGAGELGAGAGVADQRLGDGGEAGVLGVVQVVGLGGGEEDAVDAAAEDRREPGARAGAEAGEDLGHGGAQVLDRARAVVDGAERVDQHDLTVEAGEVVAEEGCDDDALVGLEALLEGAPERGGRARRSGFRSGEKVRAGEPSRSPGIRKRPGATLERPAAREAAR